MSRTLKHSRASKLTGGKNEQRMTVGKKKSNSTKVKRKTVFKMEGIKSGIVIIALSVSGLRRQRGTEGLKSQVQMYIISCNTCKSK